MARAKIKLLAMLALQAGATTAPARTTDEMDAKIMENLDFFLAMDTLETDQAGASAATSSAETVGAKSKAKKNEKDK